MDANPFSGFYFTGDCDMALCGGVSCIIDPRIFVSLSKAKMISPEGISKPFSSRADGYGRGEGCGIVLLKPLKKVHLYTFIVCLWVSTLTIHIKM